jgi:transposase
VEQEDTRRASRERDRLITEQTAHTNRIKALLRLRGMATGNPRRRDWLTWLARQRDWQGQAVPPQLLAEVTREHARLMLMRDQLAALEETQAAQAPVVPAQTAERRDLLGRLKALGPAFTATLTNEVFYKDFRNRREVASYVGLAPSPWQSGGIDREQGISKAGNPRARLKAIELAWLWLRHQADSELSRWFRSRTANAGKRARRIAIVALARKLIVALWRYLTTGLVPAGATMKAWNRTTAALRFAAVRAGWMMTVPPMGRTDSRFVDGSHPQGFLAASMRNVGPDHASPTGYEVMQ